MNQAIVDYVFSASAKTITLPTIASVDPEAIRFIRNLTTNTMIYSFAESSPGVTVAGNVITFSGSNSGMADTDLLAIQYDAFVSQDTQQVTDINIGSKSDASASTDTGTFSLISLFKRFLDKFTNHAQDTYVTGDPGQSALGNNIFLATAGTTAYDTFSNGVTYRSFYAQIIGSAGISAGQVIFEGSNDPAFASAHTLVIQDDSVATGAVLFAATAIAANANRYFSGRTAYRYVRCRISTAFVGGTVRAIIKFSTLNYFPKILSVAQATGQNFATTISSSLPAGSSIIGAVNLASGVAVTDIARAALVTTTTTAAITPGNVPLSEFTINVTAVSGTNPTLDVQIQISKDAGTNWIPIYDFPRITATGSYSTPILRLEGNRIRYIQTVGGTTPSFTRALIRNASSGGIGAIIRQQFDRTVDITALNSTTPTLWAEGSNEAVLVLATGTGAITVPVVLSLEGSEDNLIWYELATVIGTSPSTAYQVYKSGVLSKFLRARVSTAGDGSLNYVSIKARGE